MPIEIWAALIGACAVVLAALISSRPIPMDLGIVKVNKSRRKAITGVWRGTQHQKIESGVVHVANVNVKFEISGRRVLGKGEVFYPDRPTEHASFNFEGGFKTESFLHINYQNVDTSKIQFGVWIVRLSSNGQALSGKVLGYGIDSDTVVPALVKLAKLK